MKHSQKVSAKCSVPVATRRTCNVPSDNFADVFCTELSDTNDEDNNAGSSISSTESSEGVSETVKDAVATIPTEIVELHKINFDGTLDLDETKDM